jgi:hypothetical protein
LFARSGDAPERAARWRIVPHGQAATHTRQEASHAGRGRAAAGLDVTAHFAHELYAVLEGPGADEELLAVVGSWRDTLDDAEVLAALRDWNTGRPILHRRQ